MCCAKDGCNKDIPKDFANSNGNILFLEDFRSSSAGVGGFSGRYTGTNNNDNNNIDNTLNDRNGGTKVLLTTLLLLFTSVYLFIFI